MSRRSVRQKSPESKKKLSQIGTTRGTTTEEGSTWQSGGRKLVKRTSSVNTKTKCLTKNRQGKESW